MNSKYMEMKVRIGNILEELCKRFRGNIKWEELLFSNEESKYFSLLILCKYLGQDKINEYNNLLSTIFRHLKEINFSSRSGYDIEKLLKCVLILGMRLSTNIKERIIIALSQFKEYLKSKKESDEKHIISNILELTEKIVNYLYNIKMLLL